MLKGYFPVLTEVRLVDEDDEGAPEGYGGVNWFEVDAETSRVWLEVLRHRPNLNPFNQFISSGYYEEYTPDEQSLLFQELLPYLSDPANQRVLNCIKVLELETVDLDGP